MDFLQPSRTLRRGMDALSDLLRLVALVAGAALAAWAGAGWKTRRLAVDHEVARSR